MARTLLIDADLLAYRCTSANQKSYKWFGEDGPVSTAAHFDLAKEAAEADLNYLIDTLKPDELIVCLSDDMNSFRKDRISPDYKGNRTTERPLYLYDLKDWFREEYITQEYPYLEADDVMGIIATDPERTDERIIVSNDKDMLSIPGKLYRPLAQVDAQGRHRKTPLIYEIEPFEAVQFHFWQTIVGDTVDGYGGAPGVGPKSVWAEGVWEAEDEVEAWECVLCAFQKSGQDELAALTQARLAKILHHADFDGQKARLWLPPYWE